jgi:tRNA-uridine 2-sulfurtransferase
MTDGNLETPLLGVAMSGGLDSSVAAWKLAQEGHRVVGLSMLLWDYSQEPPQEHPASGGGRCCGALDLGDARRVAAQAGIPHYTLKMDEEFRVKVVDPFVRDYLEGRTPSPCVACNTSIKFDRLFDRARSFGAETVATGHYARLLAGPHGPELHTARDEAKDQSYFLFELTPEQLARTMFPLGELTKPEVRALARQAGLVVAEKAESMEICFVPGSVREFVEHQVAARPEDFGELGERITVGAAQMVDSAGVELGRGEPFYRYTVGQRKALGLGGGEKRYVLAVLPAENRIVVGGGAELLAHGLTAERLHWTAPELAGEREIEVTAKIRSRHGGVAARVRPGAAGTVAVEFSEPQRGVTPGQATVFYQGTRVVGGAWITGSLS